MSDNQQSVAEALPAAIYAVPDHVEQRVSLAQKLEQKGPQALTTAEVLTMILGTGAGVSAKAVLRRHALSGLEKLDPFGIKPSMSKTTAAKLAAALELHRRLVCEHRQERSKLNNPADVFRQVRDLARKRKEHLIGLYLDAQNGLLHRETLSIGSLNTTRTHPREILFPAIQHTALGFILAHNHPSGCLEPSPDDVEFTHAVRRAGELMGIELYDHLIVAGTAYTSLRERGLL